MSLPSQFLRGNVPLALIAALTWGGGDFAGGMGVKRAGGSLSAALHVVLLSHTASLVALLLFAVRTHAPVPHGSPLLWSMLAGLFGSLSVLAFYVCLARGAMGSSAAISGLLAAAIPSVVSTVLEGAPAALHLAGFLIAALAIWLIASTSGRTAVPPGTLLLSIVSGAGFGLYFVALRMAGVAGVVWPLALGRSVSILVCLTGLVSVLISGRVTASTSSTPGLNLSAVAWALGAALLDTSGNLFFISATRAGRLDVAAVLSSLYPASTILLAAWLLRERFSRRQGLGMVVATAAVVLITL